MSDVFHGLHAFTSTPSCYLTSHPGQLSLAIHQWDSFRHAVYLNLDSPLSVASQCKLVLRAIETEISAILWTHVAREGLYVQNNFQH